MTTERPLALARALGVPAEALDAAHALARTLRACGETARARTIYAGLLALDPADHESAIALAAIALDEGDARAALDAAGRALSAARSIEAELLFARALLLEGATEDARAWLARIADRDARAHAILAQLGTPLTRG